MALQGTLDTFALPDVLRLLAATKKSGHLRLMGSRGSGTVAVDDGRIGTIEAPHAPHATEPVDLLFELLRFDEGSFTFDADSDPGTMGASGDLEELLAGAEELLVEWREIESVVPSMHAWVTLRRELVTPKVSIDRAHWTTVVAVGGGATVRHMSEELSLPEMPVSRAVRDLHQLGLVDIAEAAPLEKQAPHAPRRAAQPTTEAADATPAPISDLISEPIPPAISTVVADDDVPLPPARPLRARRPKGAAPLPQPSGAEPFVPLDLPGQGPAASYDQAESPPAIKRVRAEPTEPEDIAAAFPGLAGRTPDLTPADDDDELARQLATLSPRAAEAVRAAAKAATVEERDAAVAEAVENADDPINRGQLLKFLSSVKS